MGVQDGGDDPGVAGQPPGQGGWDLGSVVQHTVPDPVGQGVQGVQGDGDPDLGLPKAGPREVLGAAARTELWSLTDRHLAVEVADAVALRAQALIGACASLHPAKLGQLGRRARTLRVGSATWSHHEPTTRI